MTLPAQRPARIRIERIWPQIDGGRYPVKRTLGERVDVWATLAARRPRGARRRAALPPAPERAAGARRRSTAIPRGSRPLARLVRGRPRSDAGSSASSRGSTAWRAGSASWSARSRPGRPISRASCWRARRCSGVAVAHRRGGPGGEGRRSLRADDRRRDARDHRRQRARDVRLAGTSSSRARGAASPASRSSCPQFAKLGFDVLYLPPVHPIGLHASQGPQQRHRPRAAADPGSPWAIGSELGGHTALHPDLGSAEEFARLTARAAELGIAIALDFAIQCSPDHPWLREHPDWFHRRPDGTLKYAENPPKRYQDIYNVNFDTEDWRALWSALRDVVLHWVSQGVTVFRVDNPHTKPIAFWEWLIADVQQRAPRDGLPGRGVHAPGDDGAAGEGRLQPVLHVLHVAQHEGRADVVHDGPDALGAASVLPAELLRQHARHPPRLPRRGRAAGVRGAPRAGRDALAVLRALLRLRALRERAAQRGQRGVPELREVRDQEAQPGRAAALADRPPQRRPACQSRAAAARQPHVPRDRERAPDRLPQAHGRQHRDHVRQPRPGRAPRGRRRGAARARDCPSPSRSPTCSATRSSPGASAATTCGSSRACSRRTCCASSCDAWRARAGRARTRAALVRREVAPPRGRADRGRRATPARLHAGALRGRVRGRRSASSTSSPTASGESGALELALADATLAHALLAALRGSAARRRPRMVEWQFALDGSAARGLAARAACARSAASSPTARSCSASARS